MTAQETNLFNAFETTLTATVGASDLNFTVNNLTLPGTDVSGTLYVVINPDSATNREVILITSVNSGTKTLTCDNINKRYLEGSAATSGSGLRTLLISDADDEDADDEDDEEEDADA